jgi:hypothetical protein
MNTVVPASNPLEEALNSLNLDGCLMLSNLLLQKAIFLRQEEASKGKPKILKANDVPSMLKP